jgi:DNA invertase Pin-like site-specific DNA recombinase
MPSRRAVWARVPTDQQESGNQLPALRQRADRRGREIAAEYVVEGTGVPQLDISGVSGVINLIRQAKR